MHMSDDLRIALLHQNLNNLLKTVRPGRFVFIVTESPLAAIQPSAQAW
jgi:hypothetical protein